MKTLLIALLTLSPTIASAEYDFNCQESAVNYILNIANAPYSNPEWKLTETDLEVVSRNNSGDGAEAYELFVYQRKDSSQVYSLKLYVEEIGGICPLEKFEVTYR